MFGIRKKESEKQKKTTIPLIFNFNIVDAR